MTYRLFYKLVLYIYSVNHVGVMYRVMNNLGLETLTFSSQLCITFLILLPFKCNFFFFFFFLHRNKYTNDGARGQNSEQRTTDFLEQYCVRESSEGLLVNVCRREIFVFCDRKL